MEYNAQTIWQIKNNVSPGLKLKFNNTSIEPFVIKKMTPIKEIKIPENVKIINKKAFYHCYSLKNFVIPEGVTTIGDNVFERCGSLESINIPASVTELGKDSFRSCTKVKVTVASGTSITASDLSKAGLSSSQYTFE